MLLKRAWSKQTSCSTSAEVSAAEMRLVISWGFKSPAGLLPLVLLGAVADGEAVHGRSLWLLQGWTKQAGSSLKPALTRLKSAQDTG